MFDESERPSGNVLSACIKIEDDDSDDLDAHQFERFVPQSMEELCRTTKYDADEIRTLYRSFKQECPNGMVSEEKFKHLYAQFFPLGDAREYAGFIFGVLDVDMAGSVTFDQFLVTMSLLTRGTPEEKIRWLFKLYDLDGDGFITPNELLKILLSLYHMLGRSTVPHSDRATIQNHANRVFQKLDQNSDGLITQREFMDSCKKDRNISKCLAGLFDSAL